MTPPPAHQFIGMAKIKIGIDRSENNYSAVGIYQCYTFVATHKTFEGVKKALLDSVRQTHEWELEAGKESDLDQLEPIYDLTISALLGSLTNVITRTSLSKATGINPKQLSHYAQGIRRPRPAQAERIRDGIRRIGLQLSQV